MHILTLTEGIDYRGLKMGAGEYLVEDRNLWEMGYMAAGGTARARSAGILPQALPAQGSDGEGFKMLIVRPGGLGALMHVGCVVREVKHRWPKATVMICCAERMQEVFYGLPYPDGFVNYPPRVEEVEAYDAVVCLEGCTEWGEESRTLHIADAFAGRVGVEMSEFAAARVPAYAVSAGERLLAGTKYAKGAKPRVGIHPQGSCACRSYPFDLLAQVVERLVERGWEVMMLGAAAENPAKTDKAHGVYNVASDWPGLRAQCAVLETCDVVLAPDSVFMHVAVALGVPLVALFGSTDWKLRLPAVGPRVTVLRDAKSCEYAPCHFYPRSPMEFPTMEKAPCRKSGVCAALAGVEVKRIVAKVEAAKGA